MRKLAYCTSYETETFDTAVEALEQAVYEIKREGRGSFIAPTVVHFDLWYDHEEDRYGVTYTLEGA